MSKLTPPPLLVPNKPAPAPPPPKPAPAPPPKASPPPLLVPTPTQPAPFDRSTPVTPPPSSGGSSSRSSGGSSARRSTSTPTQPTSPTAPTIANAQRLEAQKQTPKQLRTPQMLVQTSPITQRGIPQSQKFPKTVGQDTRSKLQIVASRIRQASEQQKKAQPESFGKRFAEGTVGQFGLGVASGVATLAVAVSRPKETTQQIGQFTKQFVKNPIKVSTEIVRGTATDLVLNPAFTLGEFFTFGKTINTVAKATQKSSLGRAISKEMYIRQLPKEIQKPARVLINSAEKQRLINPIPKKDISKVGFFDVKELNKVEAQALQRTLKQTDSVVFGTASARVLSGQKTRLPADVDLATAKPKQFVQQFVKNLPPNQRNLYKIKGAKLYRGNKPIMDIKDFSKLYPQKSLFRKKGELPVSGYVLKLDRKKGSLLPTIKRKGISDAFTIPTSPVVKVKGINFAGFGEQTTRKALGTIQVLVENNIKRAKDLADLVSALKVQLRALQKVKTINPIKKFQNKRAITAIQKALKLLQSKSFKELFNKKVRIGELKGQIGALTKQSRRKGLSSAKKSKISKDIARLRAELANLERGATQKARIVDRTRQRLTPRVARVARPRRLVKRVSKARLVRTKPKVSAKPIRRITSRRITLAKRKTQRLSRPRKLRRTRRSRLPTRKPSRLPKARVSRLPASRLARSRIPKSRLKPSRVPASRLGTSRVPASRLPPSRLPPSKLPPSKLPPSRLPPSRLPPSRLPPTRRSGRLVPPVKEPPVKIRPKLKKRLPFDTDVKNPRGFNAWIKTPFGWRRANPKPLARAEANKLGRYVSDNSLSASFVVVGTRNKAVKTKVPFDAPVKRFRLTRDKRM
jgi:hypothetical protein